MDIQREAIVEIISTQYGGDAKNHKDLFWGQKLVMKHQIDNISDHDMVILLTDDAKELGFIPKDYASLYASAIDSGKYNFSIEIIKNEPDAQEPKLVVKITTEANNCFEKEVEKRVSKFIQYIANEYAFGKKEYLQFVYSETVNTDELLSSLNRVRLMHKLYSLSEEVIVEENIKQLPLEHTPYTREMLIKVIDELRTDISDILKKIQRAYNDSLDIDDEEEYHRVQSGLRKRRKRFRSLAELFTRYREAVQKYVAIAAEPSFDIAEKNVYKNSKSDVNYGILISEAQQNLVANNMPNLTEEAFFDWLVSTGGVSELTAKQYISNIHSIEKLYQTIFGVRRSLLGSTSIDDAKVMIETLIQQNEYIDANERRHNSFGAALNKFIQFADLSVENLGIPSEKNSFQTPFSSKPFVIKTVDFKNPHSCTFYKPCSFVLNESRYSIGSWRELYAKFLISLYTDNTYSELLKGLIGKSLCGRRIDFADKTLLHCLRNPIEVSKNFFSAGNLSAVDIIKRIKCLMELCSIDDKHMVIEYNTLEEDDKTVVIGESAIDVSEDHKQLSMPAVSEQVTADMLFERPAVPATENLISDPLPERSLNDTLLPASSFAHDTSKPFELKDAVIEILSSDAPEIIKHREHRNGISTKTLSALLKEYYGKAIGLFEISSLLMADNAFQPVGKGCYILKQAILPQEILVSEKQPITPMKKTNGVTLQDEPYTTNNFVDVPAESLSSESVSDANDNNVTVEEILNVIRKNKDSLQYEDGFGAYEIKTLLANQGSFTVSEEAIETLLSECSELKEIEAGYYILADIKDSPNTSNLEISVVEEAEVKRRDALPEPLVSEANAIVLSINGNIVRAYDYSDALNKICEFAINYTPFRMARIAGQGILINGDNVFYREIVPVNGYGKLSNGLQIKTINSFLDLQIITNKVKEYCQIKDDMIDIFIDKGGS